MSNELIQAINFTKDQIDLIKTQIAPKASEDELKLFLHYCKRSGLDPLSRQIYAIHRWSGQHSKEVMSIQTSIDGYRLIAERSGEYGGQDEPIFIYDENNNLIGAKITVYRFRGVNRYPAGVGVAYLSEYMPIDKTGKPMGLWLKMPRVMISKVAEALALRKAFPQDLAGIYVEEEMQQINGSKYDDTFDEVGNENRQYLLNLLETSTYDHRTRVKMAVRINSITQPEAFELAKNTLLANQLDYDSAVNPGQKEISKQVRKQVNREE